MKRHLFKTIKILQKIFWQHQFCVFTVNHFFSLFVVVPVHEVRVSISIYFSIFFPSNPLINSIFMFVVVMLPGTRCMPACPLSISPRWTPTISPNSPRCSIFSKNKKFETKQIKKRKENFKRYQIWKQMWWNRGSTKNLQKFKETKHKNCKEKHIFKIQDFWFFERPLMEALNSAPGAVLPLYRNSSPDKFLKEFYSEKVQEQEGDQVEGKTKAKTLLQQAREMVDGLRDCNNSAYFRRTSNTCQPHFCFYWKCFNFCSIFFKFWYFRNNIRTLFGEQVNAEYFRTHKTFKLC